MDKGHSKSKSQQTPVGSAAAFLAEDVRNIKANPWWCADYSCSSGGTVFNSGDVRRICFVTPPATGCPTPTTLADGSIWAKTGGEAQDG